MNVIVIPCFNEANRLKKNKFEVFLEKSTDINIVFSNDGSTDNTINVLEGIKSNFQEKVHIVISKSNQGKAEAVRSAILYSQKCLNFDKIAYLDADLSTSLEECSRIFDVVKGEILFGFGSRIRKIDNHIERKFYRFFIGRVLATIISKQLHLKVYDTQCGCKVFTKDLAHFVFREKFISKWLFDVEIFHRIIGFKGLSNMKNVSREIPLHSWVDTEESNVKASYFFKLWLDLFKIGRKYSNV